MFPPDLMSRPVACCIELNHMPTACAGPVNSFEFQPCDRTPRRGTYWLRHRRSYLHTQCPSFTRGLPGYQSVCSPRCLSVRVSQKAAATGVPLISAHFTATPGIPLSPASRCPVSSAAELSGATPDLSTRLHAFTPSGQLPLRITAAAGT